MDVKCISLFLIPLVGREKIMNVKTCYRVKLYGRYITTGHAFNIFKTKTLCRSIK